GRNVRLDIRIIVHDCYWTVVTVAGEAGVTLVTGLRRTRCLERLGRPAGLAGLELPGLVAHDCYRTVVTVSQAGGFRNWSRHRALAAALRARSGPCHRQPACP